MLSVFSGLSKLGILISRVRILSILISISLSIVFNPLFGLANEDEARTSYTSVPVVKKSSLPAKAKQFFPVYTPKVYDFSNELGDAEFFSDLSLQILSYVETTNRQFPRLSKRKSFKEKTRNFFRKFTKQSFYTTQIVKMMQTKNPEFAVIWFTLYSFQLSVIFPTMIAMGIGHLYPLLGMIPWIESSGLGYSAVKYWREKREVQRRFGRKSSELDEVKQKYQYQGMPKGVSFFEVIQDNDRQIIPVVQSFQVGVSDALQKIGAQERVLTTKKLEELVDNRELQTTLMEISGDSHVYQKLLIQYLLTQPDKRVELLDIYGQVEYYERNEISDLLTKMDRAQEQIASFQMAYTPVIQPKVIFSSSYRTLFFRAFKINRDLAREKSSLRMLQYALINDIIESEHEVDYVKYKSSLKLLIARIRVLKAEMVSLVENELVPSKQYSRQMTCEHPFLGLVK